MPLQTFPPMVSCIMPTRDRRAFVPHAIENFHRQTWENKELIVVDDGRDPVEDLCQNQPNVRYIRLPEVLSIGAKRNICCEAAKGEIIAHFDDDDWYGPGYLTHQVSTIRQNDVIATGLHTAPFVNRKTRRAFIYRNHPDYCIGATITFRKAHWMTNRFQDWQIAEDNQFVQTLDPGHYLFTDHNGHFIATDHGSNTSPRDYQREDSFDGKDLLAIIGATQSRSKRHA